MSIYNSNQLYSHAKLVLCPWTLTSSEHKKDMLDKIIYENLLSVQECDMVDIERCLVADTMHKRAMVDMTLFAPKMFEHRLFPTSVAMHE